MRRRLFAVSLLGLSMSLSGCGANLAMTIDSEPGNARIYVDDHYRGRGRVTVPGAGASFILPQAMKVRVERAPYAPYEVTLHTHTDWSGPILGASAMAALAGLLYLAEVTTPPDPTKPTLKGSWIVGLALVPLPLLFNQKYDSAVLVNLPKRTASGTGGEQAGRTIPDEEEATRSSHPFEAFGTAFRLIKESYKDPVGDEQLEDGAVRGVLEAASRSDRVDAFLQLPHDPERFAVLGRAFDDLDLDAHDQHLEQAAIRGMVDTLQDPGTHFLPREVFQPLAEFNPRRDPDTGLMLREDADGIEIVTPVEGYGPRAAGVRPGDRLVAVGGHPVAGEPVEHVMDDLRGQEGQTIAVTVRRAGRDLPLHWRCKLPAVAPIALRDAGGASVLRIGQLDEDAVRGARLALGGRSLPHGLVLDLRDATGGKMPPLASLASLMVQKGAIAQRVGQTTNTYFSEGHDVLPRTAPLVVLVNRGTGGTAELLAADLKETGRATVVGARTAGYTALTAVYPLGDGAGLALTTGEVLTGKRRHLNGVGLAPDHVLAGADAVPASDPAKDPVVRQAVHWLAKARQP